MLKSFQLKTTIVFCKILYTHKTGKQLTKIIAANLGLFFSKFYIEIAKTGFSEKNYKKKWVVFLIVLELF